MANSIEELRERLFASVYTGANELKDQFIGLRFTPHEPNFLNLFWRAVEIRVEQSATWDKRQILRSLHNAIKPKTEILEEKLGEFEDFRDSHFQSSKNSSSAWKLFCDRYASGELEEGNIDFYCFLKSTLFARLAQHGNVRLLLHNDWETLFQFEEKDSITEEETTLLKFLLGRAAMDVQEFMADFVGGLSEVKVYYWLKGFDLNHLPKFEDEEQEENESPTAALNTVLTQDELAYFLQNWQIVFAPNASKAAIAEAFARLTGKSEKKLRQKMSNPDLSEEKKEKVKSLVEELLRRLQG